MLQLDRLVPIAFDNGGTPPIPALALFADMDIRDAIAIIVGATALFSCSRIAA